jgi:hypothetical protein
MKILLERDPEITHIIRTNISSLLDFDRIKPKLKENMFQGRNIHDGGYFFGSGSCLIFSRNIVSILLEEAFENDNLKVPHPCDDVAISILLKKREITPENIEWCEYDYNFSEEENILKIKKALENDIFQYRLRQHNHLDRINEIRAREIIEKIIYVD